MSKSSQPTKWTLKPIRNKSSQSLVSMVSTHYDTSLKHIVEVSLNGRCPQIILDVFGNSPWGLGLHSLRLVVLLFLEALDEASPKSTDPQSVSLLGQSLGGIQYTSIYINIPTTPHALAAKFSIWKPVQPRNLLKFSSTGLLP